MNSLSLSVAQSRWLASSFLNYPLSCILFAIVLCICILTLIFLMRTGREVENEMNHKNRILGKRAIQDLCVSGHPGLWRKCTPTPRAVLASGLGSTLYTCQILGTSCKLSSLAVILAFRKRPHFAHVTLSLMLRHLAIWGLHWGGPYLHRDGAWEMFVKFNWLA